MFIAVDFDGTVVDHRFPKVGQDVPGAVEALTALLEEGHQLILFTMRSEESLDDAVNWYLTRGLRLHGIQTNPTQRSWTRSPKAYANAYIDDAAVGCPLIKPEGFARPCVNWPEVMKLIHLHDAGPIGGHK